MSEYVKIQTGTTGSETTPIVGRAENRYSALEQYRRPFLERARDCSELTIPYLIPPDGWNGTKDLYTPFQSMGARGVNNISSKLMIALFPVNQPFMRLRMDGPTEDQAKKADPALKTEIEDGLANVEKKFMTDMETKAMRPHLYEGVRHMVVGGNVLLHFPDEHRYIETEASVRVFHLDRYVVKRDPQGNVLEIVVKESVAPSSLDESFYAAAKAKAGANGDDKTCDIYTYIYVTGVGRKRRYNICQEVHGEIVPDSEGSYPLNKLPWLPLRWNKIDDEDYGRGYVEEYLGDLKSLEGLEQSIVEGSAAAAKVIFFVAANGTTKREDLEKAPNGAVRTGNAEDVSVLHLEKFNDFQVAAAEAEKIEKRLAQAFMLNSSAQRSGERVTAEEWRFMIQDIEDALGGIYSVLAHELQLPLVRLQMDRLTREKKIPAMPKGSVRPVIVTGLEALGRSHEREKTVEFMKDFIGILTPEIAVRYINPADLAKRLAMGSGIDTVGLIKTPAEMQKDAEAQAAQQTQDQTMQMVQKLGPAGIKAMTEAHAQGQTSGAANGQGVTAGGGQPPTA